MINSTENLFDPMALADVAYPTLKLVFFVIVILLVSDFLISVFRKSFSKRAHTRRQKSNVEIFLRFIKYGVFLSVVFAVLLRYSSSFQQFGLVLGALTAGLGFALQKPITAVAAWLMLIFKRPFDIGDRVIIGDVKGNVIDISLTHIHLEEVGRYGGEEVSGRVVIIPSSLLFEKSITNYSLYNDYILGQVVFTVSYKSNVDRAIEIAIASAQKFTGEYDIGSGKDTHSRLYFSTNGMEIHVRYSVPFGKAQEIATNITKDIYDTINQSDDIEISYTQTKVTIEK